MALFASALPPTGSSLRRSDHMESEDDYTADDYAYALAQLTDDCEFEWIRQITGLSVDECDKIMRISYAAQQRTWK